MLTSFNDFVCEKIEFTDNYKMTSEILPIISLSLITPEYVIDTYGYEMDGDDDDNEQTPEQEYWDKFSIDKYYDKLLEKSKDFTKEKILPYFRKLNIGIKNIIIVEVYKYETLYYDIRTDKLFIDRLVKKLESGDDENYDDDRMNEFLSEKYRSYPGFASFMPKSKNDLIKCLVKDYVDGKYVINESDVERGIAAFLAYRIEAVDGMTDLWIKEFNELITEDEEMRDPYNFIK